MACLSKFLIMLYLYELIKHLRVRPPWLAYRHMDRQIQLQFREECQRRGLWTGGRVATHQDLSAYFFVRCVELYLKPTGRIAFVMPYAALSRKQFERFRTGWYGKRRGKRVLEVVAEIRFTETWAFDDRVQPLFPVPSCVLFARRVTQDEGASWPDTILSWSGKLPHRNATPAEASQPISLFDRPRSFWMSGASGAKANHAKKVAPNAIHE